MAENLPKPPGNWRELVVNLPKLAETGGNWRKPGGNCPELARTWPNLAQPGENWRETARNWPELARNWPNLAQTGENWPASGGGNRGRWRKKPVGPAPRPSFFRQVLGQGFAICLQN